MATRLNSFFQAATFTQWPPGLSFLQTSFLNLSLRPAHMSQLQTPLGQCSFEPLALAPDSTGVTLAAPPAIPWCGWVGQESSILNLSHNGPGRGQAIESLPPGTSRHPKGRIPRDRQTRFRIPFDPSQGEVVNLPPHQIPLSQRIVTVNNWIVYCNNPKGGRVGLTPPYRPKVNPQNAQSVSVSCD